VLGRKILRWYPYVPIGGELGLNCAMLSYSGTAYFGFTGDAPAAPHLHRLEKFLRMSFAELQKSVGIRLPRQRREPPKHHAESAPKSAAKEEEVALAASA